MTTKTAQFTPGPWGYNPISCDVEAIAISERIAMVETDVAWDEAKKSEIVHANGHLIAAAPAMYADAKQLCELVRDFMNDNRLYDGQVIQAISNLETALSQAEGRDK